MTYLKQAAIDYNDRGFYVFPIVPNGKTPLQKGYKRSELLSKRNPNLIKNIWTKNPKANIGLILPQGYYVLDLDKKDGKNGVKYINEIIGYKLTSFPGPIAQTCTGGVHIFVRATELIDYKLGSRANLFENNSGVDIKGNNNGYVVIPPSVVGDNSYKWLRPLNTLDDIPNIPQKILDAIIDWKNKSIENTNLIEMTDVTKLQKGLRDSFDLVRDAIINSSKGERNLILHKKVFYLANKCLDYNIDPKIIVDFILTANNDCTEPENESAVLSTLHSSIQHAKEKFFENCKHLLTRNLQGKPIANDSNVYTVLTMHYDFKGMWAYDERSMQPMIRERGWIDEDKKEKIEYPRNLIEGDYARICSKLDRDLNISSSINQIDTILRSVMSEKEHTMIFDPFADILNNLEKWDGNSRLNHWLPKICGCEDNNFNKLIGRYFVMSIVARTFDPGCKVDTVLCLLGDQGVYKSTFCETMAFNKRFYQGKLGDLNSKDTWIALQSAAIVEIAEIAAFKKADVETIKQFISNSVDVFRPPFGKLAHGFPRRCVFVATSNQDKILKDPSGGRRFWPIEVDNENGINIDWIVKNRNQLFAEAIVEYNAGAQWWFDKNSERELDENNLKYQEDEIWTESVLEYLALNKEQIINRYFNLDNLVNMHGRKLSNEFIGNDSINDYFDKNGNRLYVTTKEILINVIELKLSQIKRTDEMRVGNILKLNKWKRVRKRINGVRIYVFMKKGLDSEQCDNVTNIKE